MIITKNKKEYSVTELKNTWKLTLNLGSGVTIDYNIDKGIAPAFNDLERYVNDSELF